MTSTQDVQQLGGPAAPRVVRVPSLRRLLRPGPTVVLLALLVGAASAPTGQEADAAGSPGHTGARGSTSVPQVPGWQQEADPRTPVAVGSGAALPVAPSPVVLPLSPVVLVEPPGAPGSAVGVGTELWAAYRSAAAAVPASCHLDPRLLAAIGQVESGSLAGRALDSHHRAVPPVLGPVLDGNGFARIPDTDHGRWDGDPVWDRAVGPMQFIPSTWARWGVDANGDGVADPQDIQDASLAAADYLCADGRDLSAPADLRAAILSYNHSTAYLATVLALVPRMTPGALGGPGVGTGPVISAALFVGPPSAPPPAAAVPESASPTTRPSATSSQTTSPTTATGTPTTAASPRTATRTWTGSPTTAATSTTSASSTTTGSPTTTGTTSTSATTSTTSATTSAPSSTSSATGTSSPSTSATTTACPSGSTTATTTSGTTSPTSPTGTASPTPTASCTTTAAPTRTPVPSTSSATATEATLLGRAG